jgi:hypothetical protein
MALRRLAVTASVLCMTIGVAACGGDGGQQAAEVAPKAKTAPSAAPSTPAKATAKATPKPAPASKAPRSSRGEERKAEPKAGKLTAPALTAKVVAAANDKGTARIKLAKKNPQLERFEGSVRFGAKDFARRSEVVSQGAAVGMIVLPKAIYMKVPGMTDDEKKPWVDVLGLGTSKDSSERATAAMLAWMRQSIDPTSQIAGLKYGTIRSTTKADVDGTATTKYHLELRLADLAKLQTGAQEVYEQLASRGVKKLDYDLYVDGDFLPRRLVVPVLTDGAPLDFLYYDWGASLDLGAPPAGQIGKLPKN